MRFINLRKTILLLQFTVATTEITQVDIQNVVGSTFILDSLRNKKFLKFRQIYRSEVEQIFECEKKSHQFTETQIIIYETHREEVIDVAFINFYNIYGKERICNFRPNVFINFKMKIIHLNGIEISKIPVDGLEFFDPIDIGFQNTGIASTSEFESLERFPNLKYISCQKNKITTLPDFSGFPELKTVYLEDNPIVIRSPEDIKPNPNIRYFGLRNIKGIDLYMRRLMRAYGKVSFSCIPYIAIERKVNLEKRIPVPIRMRTLAQKSPKMKVPPNVEKFIDFCIKYHTYMKNNLNRIVESNDQKISPRRMRLLKSSAFNDILYIALAHYYNMWYLRWWKMFEWSPEVEREIIDDIENYNVRRIHRLWLDNIGISLFNPKALWFFNPIKLCMMNCNITTENISELKKLKNLRILNMEHNSIPNLPRLDGFKSLCVASFESNRCPMDISNALSHSAPYLTIKLRDVPNIGLDEVIALKPYFNSVESTSVSTSVVRLHPKARGFMNSDANMDSDSDSEVSLGEYDFSELFDDERISELIAVDNLLRTRNVSTTPVHRL